MLIPLLVALAPLLTARSAEVPATSATMPLEIRQVEMGFQGNYKLGFWTPVRVTLTAAQAVTGRLEVTVPDADGIPTTVSSDRNRPMSIAAGETVAKTLYVKPGQAGGSVEIRFMTDEQVLVEKTLYPDTAPGPGAVPPGLPATARLIVVIGGDIDLATTLRVGAVDPAVATHVASMSVGEHLPDQAIGWDAVDAVVLLASKPDLYLTDGFAAGRSALAEWLELGGRLFAFVGRSAEELLRPGDPLAPFVPGEFQAVEPMRQPGAIEELCDSQYPLRMPAGVFRLPVAHLAEVRGRVAAYGGNMPLVIRAAPGFGELVWVNFDLDAPPLDDWAGTPVLLRRLIGVTEEIVSRVADDAGKLTSLGYTDLIGQLRAALDVFPGVQVASFAWVIGLTLVYLALLGPLDYLLVHRWGRRPVLTWLTLPLFALVVGGGAYGLAHAAKGDRLRLNQVELVDVDLESGLIRGNLWAHLYTPRHDRFALTLQPRLFSAASNLAEGPQHATGEAVLSWLGLPGAGLGGVEAAADAYSIEQGYGYEDDRRRLEGLPLAIWSSKSLHGRWKATAEVPFEAALVANPDGELVGQLSSGLDHELTNVRIYYQGRIYRLGTIRPGRTVTLDPRETLSVSAGDHLRRVTTLGTAAPPYDAALRDAGRTLQMMMWYELAGGAAYVGLINRYQSDLDFGHLLDAGRAVLVAETPKPGSQLLRDDEPLADDDGLRLLVCRFILPVEPAGTTD